MARRPRLQFPGAVYHVMSRGNRKSTIFNTDDDRRCFMNILGESALTYHVRVYAACLMGTHYHLLLDTPRGNLSAWMRQLNGDFGQDCNRRYQRTGHTLENRFRSIVVQREKYLRRVARYVVANPVAAGLCADAASWPWSTYRATAGLEEPPRWAYVDWIDWAFRTTSRREAQQRYRDYVNTPAAQQPTFETRGFILGTARFQTAVLTQWRQSQEDRPVPRFCQAAARRPLDVVFAEIEADYRSRDAAILMAHEDDGYRLSEMAAFLKVDPSTVSRALTRARADRVKGGPSARS